MRCWPTSRHKQSSVVPPQTEKPPRADPSAKDRSTEASLIVFSYSGRNYLFRRPNTHQDALNLIRSHVVPYNVAATDVRFLARIPAILPDEDVEITSEAWAETLPLVTKAQVVLFDKVQLFSAPSEESIVRPPFPPSVVSTPSPFPDPLSVAPVPISPNYPRHPWPGTITLRVRSQTGLITLDGISLPQTIRSVKERIQEMNSTPACEQVLSYLGVDMEDDKTLADYGVQHNSTVSLSDLMNIWPTAVRKPVIYLYPPAPMDVTVRLSLVSQWHFSALYPEPLHDKASGALAGQAIEWNVHARNDGTLTDKLAGVDVAYLYWEAEPHACPASPPASRPGTPEVHPTERLVEDFIPGITRCSPTDSVLLEANQVAQYLDRALIELGLHTEARTSFITYWLPDILKHAFIALRFVPQASYERAAPLDISPKPDVVTRIFMLFQGVAREDTNLWEVAAESAKEPASRWRRVVGVDSANQGGAEAFRVLEWGGMELR